MGRALIDLPISTTVWKMINYWKKELGLTSWRIDCEPISIFQVSDECCRVGNQLVGIVIDFHKKTGTIYHTRKLKEEDIIHELLHVRYPSWCEEQVNRKTKECKDRKNNNERKQKSTSMLLSRASHYS